nr:1-acyl-sn-glycerol-3-phosphate acyltransferase [Jongsikchunia kroppenstedtii]
MDVDVNQSQAVYDHYREHQQNVRKARLMYGVLAARYRPRVRHIGDGRAQLRSAIRQGASLLVVANHVRLSDPLVLAAAGFRSPLRARIGHIRVLAKDELFAEPEQRRKIDALGGIPVFRRTDHGMRVALTAGQQMIDTCTYRMARGDSIAIFPEGTCNLDDPLHVQKLNSGVGHIARRAGERGADVVAVMAGIAYPDDSPRRAMVVLGEPFAISELESTTPAGITRVVQTELQAAVDEAQRRK